MDATQIFRQGLGTVAPRQQNFDQFHGQGIDDDDFLDGDSSGQRVAHTLTACCRCRQRKTRCDPSLPRCRPCEKSGSVCEYLDAAKGRKINRYYVIKLQDKVRALEAELDQYTDDAGDYPRTNEDIVRPGGLIRLSVSDETPRYLGPSSGIAMTRLLMEEAKRYTETNSVSELIPEVRARRQARMQSIQMTGAPNVRKKSFPMMSEHPAETLPNRSVANKLLNRFYQKSQVFWPIVHEKSFEADVDAVYKGDTDSYKNFVVRMAFAISLQKVDQQYAGLADGYYKSAMKYFEDVVRPKDLKTLQCLALVASYSLITPSRLATYYVIGLATRICQQEGLTDENTISAGDNVDPLTLDLRRRLVWIIATMEFGLSYYMGRPTGFAKGDDRMDVEFFSTVADENITETGIRSGPDDPRKLISIQFYRMRVYQAEIRRTLYEKKRTEPTNDSHQWYNTMENKLIEWRDSSPPGAGWSKAWFTGLYHELRAFMYRPSPQIPQPSSRAAGICYESSAYIIDMTKKSLDSGSVDATWVFLVSLTTALNTLLWSTSYEEVRQSHSREETEEYVNKTLDSLDRCAERWPGTASASEMYAIFAKACLQSYDMAAGKPMFSFASPSSTGDQQASPPQVPVSAADPSQAPFMNPPHFGYVFDSPPESMNTYTFDPNFPPPQPTFRSNSIFCNPTSTDSHGRRFSYFPPDFSQPTENAQEDPAGNTVKSEQDFTSPSQMSSHLPTPPESIPPGNLSNATPSVTFSPTLLPEQVTGLSDVSAGPMSMPLQAASTPPQKHMIPKADPSQQDPTFTIAPQVTQPSIQQRPLPTTTDWFSPLPPFVSPYNMGPSMSNNFFNEAMSGAGGFGEVPRTGMNMGNMNMRHDVGPPYGFNQARQGSLTQSQQLELMNMLETEGMGDLDNFLNTGNAMTADGRWY